MSVGKSSRRDPVVLSYKALRKAVGYVAIALPPALVIPLYIHRTVVQGSISAYYYTGLRNVFVGSLCAIAMFMLCTRGYDRKDEYAGILSALCAIGVAFCPMDPKDIPYQVPCSERHFFNHFHFFFAVSLFLILGYFCLVLFRKTAGTLTRQKTQRNRIYFACGCTIYTAMALEGALDFIHAMPSWWTNAPHLLLCETICMVAFGYAWLIKGEAFFKDVPPDHTASLTTDGLMP